ncbi:phage tail protein [Staphylococcus succinus]|uniref:phage tail protein n=1 Tax=Staphylococcus succinus TaxID=61015 RepID=UPI0009FB0F32
MALILKDLNGVAYPVEAVTSHSVKMSADGMLTFTVYENSQTEKFINDISKLWQVENVAGKSETLTYVVVIAKRKSLKSTQAVEITAKEAQFDYLETNRVYENISGSRTGVDFLNIIFDDTPYSYVLLNEVYAVEWENAGDGQSKMEMFTKALSRYGLEFQYEAASKTFRLGTKISRRPSYYISKKLNANDISFEEDATSFYTYIRGYGDYEGEDNLHEADLVREYPVDKKSPLIELFGVREAPPVTDGRITKKAVMDEKLKQELDESLKLSIEFDFVTLGRNYPFAHPEIGDEIPVIDDTIGFNQVLRIQEIKTTRDAHHKVTKQSIVVGDPKRATRYQQAQAGAIIDINDLMNGRAKIRESVLPKAISEATKMLQDTASELSFSDQGIMAVDKTNPNYVTLLNSSGLGVSKDGGQTFHNAITRGAINADLITAGSINADYIRSGTLDANLVEVVGGNDSDKYVSIKNDELRLRGRFEREWMNETSNYNIYTSMHNGYLRFRNDDLDRSLYFSEFGISTMRDQTGNYIKDLQGSSGSIIWWDTRYSGADASGITVNSYGGVAALTSSNNRALVQGDASVSLESVGSNVYIRPLTGQGSGSNTFNFTLSRSNLTNPDLPGYLMYGSTFEGDKFGGGLRFYKQSNLIEMVDGDYASTKDTTFQAGIGRFGTVGRKDGYSYIDFINDQVFKIGVDNAGARVAGNGIYYRTYSGGANMYITSAGTLGRSTSARKYKMDIENQYTDEQAQLEHSKNILDLNVRSWIDKAEAETYAKEIEEQKRISDDEFKLEKYVGLIAEEVGEVGLSEHVVHGTDDEVEGIEYDRIWIHLIPVIKKQQKQIEQLEAVINGK